MLATVQVAVERDSILVRVPTNVFSRDDIVRFLDYLEVEGIRRRSRLTRAAAEELAAEIDQSGWMQVQAMMNG